MPYSSDEGKAWMRTQILAALRAAPVRYHDGDQLAPRLLDIGAGSGTYAGLLAQEMSPWLLPHMTAVEIHEPYVGRFGLRRLYDEVVVADARTVTFPRAEVVILGDVLEHVPLDDAIALWRKAREAATVAVFLSLPIVEWPQGESEGNPHEAHVETWDHDTVIGLLPGIRECWRGEQIGCYRAEPLERP